MKIVIPPNEMIEGNEYYIQNIPYDEYDGKQKGIYKGMLNDIHAKFENIENINKSSRGSGYSIGEGTRNKNIVTFYEPNAENIINNSLQRQAVQQTLQNTNTDVIKYTQGFLTGTGGKSKNKKTYRRRKRTNRRTNRRRKMYKK
jgi:hypothetical protein